jgi:hypothetical protein
MMHRRTYFYPGWVAVPDHSAHFFAEQFGQSAGKRQILLVRMQSGRQLPFQMPVKILHFRFRLEFDH